MASSVDDARDVGAYEVVEVIEHLMEAITDGVGAPYEGRELLYERAEDLVNKLVGPERESESRWSSRHIRVDEGACENLAQSLAISYNEARMYFWNEPLKRAEKVASWALDTVDEAIIENGAIHGQRGRMVSDKLDAWASANNCGIYRDLQPEDQRTPPEARA